MSETEDDVYLGMLPRVLAWMIYTLKFTPPATGIVIRL